MYRLCIVRGNVKDQDLGRYDIPWRIYSWIGAHLGRNCSGGWCLLNFWKSIIQHEWVMPEMVLLWDFANINLHHLAPIHAVCLQPHRTMAIVTMNFQDMLLTQPTDLSRESFGRTGKKTRRCEFYFLSTSAPANWGPVHRARGVRCPLLCRFRSFCRAWLWV